MLTVAQAAGLLLGACERRGHRLRPERRDRPYDLFVFGVRNAERVADRWDDVIGCHWVDLAGEQHVLVWPGTTDPGLPYLLDPANSRGTAVLAPGQHRSSHQLGLHKRTSPALVQAASLPVFRDVDRDRAIETVGAPIYGWYGINIHGPWREGLTVVGKASAGCQVFQRGPDLGVLLGLVARQKAAGMGSVVSYTLWDAAQDPDLLALWSRVGQPG